MKKEEKQKPDVTERINSFADCLQETGMPDVPLFTELPEALREYFQKQYRLVVIAEAYNEGVKMDWADSNQKKYTAWFNMSGGGFVFYGTGSYYSYASAGYSSRLCFVSDRTIRDA